MKTIVWILLFMVLPGLSHAEIKYLLYDGNEIYVRVKKDHVTTVVFPESVNAVIRGFGADNYVIRRSGQDPKILELMPTGTQTAEMTVTGVSGEAYILRCAADQHFYAKLVIHRMEASAEKNEHQTIQASMDAVSGVLVEKPAAVQKAKTASPAPDQEQEHLPPELNQKITLKGNDLPLKIYLSTIAQVTHYNVITTPDVDAQKTSANLENLEVWRALKSLLYKFGYGFKVSQEDLIITSAETRIFNIRLPAVDQSFTDQTSNESYTDNETNAANTANSIVPQNQSVKVGAKISYENSATKLSLWSDLEAGIKSLLTPQAGSYAMSRSSGTITVTDRPGVLDKIAELVDATNDILSRQQTFEIQIYEVSLSDSNETGVDWSAIETNLNGVKALDLSTSFSSIGFAGGQLLSLKGDTSHSGRSGVSAILKALASQGTVHTISKPKITVTNLFPAIIQEVTSIPYIAGTGQTISNQTVLSNVTTSEVSDGLTMRLDAKIGNDNTTVLNIAVAVNTLDSITTVPVGGGLTIQEPQVSTKSMTTNVDIDPGQTLILGGLISTVRKNSVDGIPYLDKIPFLGRAFSYRNHSVTKSELVIIITPKDILKTMV